MKRIIAIALAVVMLSSLLVMSVTKADDTQLTYVIYDSMSGAIDSNATQSVDTDNMVIGIDGGKLVKFESYISGYNFAQWQSSTANKSLTFGLKNVPAGEYTVSFVTADNNQARGVFDITANSVAVGTLNCLDTKLSGKKLVTHDFDTKFTANGTDNVLVSIVPQEADTSRQLFLHSIVLTSTSGEIVTTVPSASSTTTTQILQDVEIIRGGEWVEGFWREGVVDNDPSNASNNKRASYNVFLKVQPNSQYTITTKLDGNSKVANCVYYKEYDANKAEVYKTNFNGYDLGSNFTKKVTTTATTEYITITLWSSFDSQVTGTDLYKNIITAVEKGNIAVSIVGPAFVDPGAETTTTTTTTGAQTGTYFTPSDVANKDNWIKGWWDSSNGKFNPTYQNNSRACVKNHVQVTEGETYKFTISGTNASGLNIVVRNYDSTGAFKSTIILTNLEYTVPAGIAYAGITIYDKTNVIDYINNGTVAVAMAKKGSSVEPTTNSTTSTSATQSTSSTQAPPQEAGVIYVNANAETNAASSTYKTLTEAFSAATAGNSSTAGTTIRFLSNVKTTSISTLSKNYVTIDLNGYTFQASSQGISIAAKYCTVKNGKMVLSTSDKNNAAYLINNANSNNVLYVRDIDFSYEKFGEATCEGRPTGLVRTSSGGNTVNIYNCTFKSNVSKRKGTFAYLPLISYMNGTVNMYNCEMDGDNNISAFTVRSSNINLYDTKILNCAYLTSKSTTLAISSSTTIKFYSGCAKYIDTLFTDPEYTTITKGDNVIFTDTINGTESITPTNLTSPYTFFATCSHKFTNGVCEKCYAQVPDTKEVAVEVENGASIRLGDVNGIRFYVSTDIDKIYDLQQSGADVELGTLIAPVDLIDEQSGLTLETPSNKRVNVPYKTKYLGTLNKDGFVGSLVKIKESNTDFDATYGNVARPMAARGYVKVTLDGETYTSYSDHSVVLSRSLGQVAKRFQDDEDAYNNLVGTDINTWMKVRDWAGIYDAQNIDSTLRYDYITVPVTSSDGVSFTETAMLGLPADYSDNGEPIRLLIDCHGYSGGSYKFQTTYSWLQYYVHQGYAVVVIDGGGSSIGAYNMGCPRAIDGHVAIYEYIKKNYNIKTDGVFVKGGSMGGITSMNLVCSGRIPVIAHIDECPVTDLFRQAYCDGWAAGNCKSIASYYGFSFDKYNADHGTNYTLSTFPWSNKSKTVSDAERELFINNFVDKVVPNNPIWKYMSCFDYKTKTFKPGYEDFLTATDEDRIEELWSTVTVDYPVPIALYHGTGDAAVDYKYSKYLAAAINRSQNSTCDFHTYNTTSHGNFGTKQNYNCKDGAVMNIYSGYDEMWQFMQEQEKIFENK